MGWGKFLGEIAKDLASDYVANRGINGMKEDFGSVASGFKSLFGSNDDNSHNEFWDTYNSLIEAEEYEDARSFVIQFYDDNEMKKDYLYYYFIAQTNNLIAINEPDCKVALPIIKEAQDNINKAFGYCPIATDDQKEIKELQNTIKENLIFLQNQKKLLDNWDKVLKQINNLTSSKTMPDINTIESVASDLMAHYKNYESGELDYYYWYYLSDLHYLSHAVAETQEIIDKYYALFLQDLDNAMSMARSDADKITEINDRRGWEHHVLLKNGNEASKNFFNYSNSESEYIAEIKACLADDSEITERERRLLDRLRITLGITEDRAKELEKMCDSNFLSSEEQEYAEEVKACLADDEVISDRERRLLDRLRKSLGISESRASEIENAIKR